MSEGVSNIYHMGKKPKEEKNIEDWYPIKEIEPDLQKLLLEGIRKINDIGDAKINANAEIKEIKTNLEAKGIPNEVIVLLLKMQKWEPAKRAWFDHAYPIARRWLFDSPQPDLFKE